MPCKHNAERRHHIAQKQFKVLNWAEYEAGRRRRGSLTMWFTDGAIDAWNAEQRLTPGGQATYSDNAIQTCLMLRSALKPALRQAEGLMRSIIELLGFELAIPRSHNGQPARNQAALDRQDSAAPMGRCTW